MKQWNGTLTREQAIQLFDRVTDKDDPYWSNLVDDFYDEGNDTMPTIYDVFSALGVTEEEYKSATGADNVNWPSRAEGNSNASLS